MTIKDYKHSLVLYQDHNLHQKTIDWCTEQFGSSGLKESGWSYGCAYDYINVAFTNDDYATLFTLTWL
jgi:hypothetical protein